MDDFFDIDWHPSENEELLLKAGFMDKQEALAAWEVWKEQNNIDDISWHIYSLVAMAYNHLSPWVKDPWMGRFQEIYRGVWLRNQVLINGVKPVLRSLAQEKIPVMLLKGFGLTLSYYKDFGLRSMADIDIMVAKKDIGRSIAILKANGWKSPDLQIEKIEDVMARAHNICFQDPHKKEMDLHWESLWCSSNSRVDEQFWSRAQDFLLDGIPVKILSPCDQFLHICLHGVRRGGNSYSEAKGRHVPWAQDAMTVITQCPSLDWETMILMSQEMDATLQLREAVFYLSDHLKAPVPKEIIDLFRSWDPTPAERIHFYYTMQPQSQHFKLVFKLWFLYMAWLRRSYGLKNVTSWNKLRLGAMFLPFLCHRFFFHLKKNPC